MTDATARLSRLLADRYHIERQLGSGGMATVYLATDVRHDRRVALKVLRPELAAVIGADRFLGEIKTTANLQHAHILGLIDSGTVDGTVFYVMPFVDGESLRDRLDREKQLPIGDAVRIARDVAAGLDYAHRRGVIHRDIKPANILLHEGEPFIADFGIALAASRTNDSGSRMTETGMSLGTPQYMSPEQAMGERTLDARTDIYSLGCVLYEMLTGEAPFTGPTSQAVIAKVMASEPEPLTTLRRSVPPNVAAATMTALSKVPADRFATAAEFADALANAQYRGTAVAGQRAGAPVQPPSRVRSVATGAIITMLAIAAITGWLRRGPVPPPALVGRFEVALPASAANTPFVVTPDGSGILWSAADGYWERRLDSLVAHRVRDVALPQSGIRAVSPDGRQLLLGGRTGMAIAPLTRGPATSIVASGRGGEWGADGYIYFSYAGPPGTPHGIARVKPDGGSVDTIAALKDSEFPNDVIALPDGKAIVAILNQASGASISALSLSDHRWHPLGISGSTIAYVDPGYLLFTSGQYLMAAPFDTKALRLTQSPVPIAEAPGGSVERFAVGGNVLAYLTAADPFGVPGIVLRSRAGTDRPLPNLPDSVIFSAFTLSPDGQRIAAVGTPRPSTSGNFTQSIPNIYVFELASGRMSRWRSDLRESAPSWIPGTNDLAFVRISVDSPSTATLMRRPWDGSAPATELRVRPMPLSGRGGSPFSAISWLNDGRRGILAVARPPAPSAAAGRGGRGGGGGGAGAASVIGDLKMLMLASPDSLLPIVVNDFAQGTPAVSPDNQLLAYTSNESGRTEVYVRPLAGGALRQVSLNGGTQPKWAHSGRELFFRNGDTLYTARVTAGPELSVERVQPVLSGGNLASGGYAVGPNDTLFIMRAAPSGESPKTVSVVVVVNIATELARIFSTGGRSATP